MNSERETLPAHDTAEESESKSQRKRNAHQITALARDLVDMKPKALASLPLDPDTRDAIRHCAEIKSHGARKRQLHFVSKLLRESAHIEELKLRVSNPELFRGRAATTQAQTSADNTSPPEAPLPATENHKSTTDPHITFRDQLLTDFVNMVDTLREKYPGVELQQVRQLVRNAQSEHKKNVEAIAASGTGKKPDLRKTKASKSLLKVLQTA